MSVWVGCVEDVVDVEDVEDVVELRRRGRAQYQH